MTMPEPKNRSGWIFVKFVDESTRLYMGELYYESDGVGDFEIRSISNGFRATIMRSQCRSIEMTNDEMQKKLMNKSEGALADV